tara:strand:+ start:12705 stop:13400 length:696 start_codon:yes stop_codon:yes gene_type:complete
LKTKEKVKELRMKYKQSVFQKHPVESFQHATAVVEGLLELDLSMDEALTQAGKWMLAHTKGPSIDEWKGLLRYHMDLISKRELTALERRQAFEVTYFFVIGMKKWHRNLKKIPQLYDAVIGATIPILSQSKDIPTKTRLLLIRAVEDVLATLDKSPKGRYRLAELRMHRGLLMADSKQPNDVDLGLRLLRQQATIFSKLAAKSYEGASEMVDKVKAYMEEIKKKLDDQIAS